MYRGAAPDSEKKVFLSGVWATARRAFHHRLLTLRAGSACYLACCPVDDARGSMRRLRIPTRPEPIFAVQTVTGNHAALSSTPAFCIPSPQKYHCPGCSGSPCRGALDRCDPRRMDPEPDAQCARHSEGAFAVHAAPDERCAPGGDDQPVRGAPRIILPDPNDRPVAAAAIAANATLILTWNLHHFPAGALKKFGLRRMTPDAFLSDLFDQLAQLVTSSLANARQNLNKSGVSAPEFIGILEGQKLLQLATRVKGHISDLDGHDRPHSTDSFRVKYRTSFAPETT